MGCVVAKNVPLFDSGGGVVANFGDYNKANSVLS